MKLAITYLEVANSKLAVGQFGFSKFASPEALRS
jgi:hypothetical protein